MDLSHLSRIASLIALSFAPLLAAQAETTQCTQITSLPYVISSSGVYCLTGDLVTSAATGNAIEVQAPTVVIDLNGHRIGGASAGTATLATGIFASNQRNITIKNGTIRGFLRAILLQDTSTNVNSSGGHLVTGIRAEGNTAVGISVLGRGNVVRNNQVLNTGGSTQSTWISGIVSSGPSARISDNEVTNTVASGSSALARGILVTTGHSSVVDNNVISETTSSATVVALSLEGANGAVVRGNQVSNTTVTANATGISVNGTNINVRDNLVSNMQNGIQFSSATNWYMGNMVNGATTAYSGGTAGTGNM